MSWWWAPATVALRRRGLWAVLGLAVLVLGAVTWSGVRYGHESVDANYTYMVEQAAQLRSRIAADPLDRQAREELRRVEGQLVADGFEVAATTTSGAAFAATGLAASALGPLWALVLGGLLVGREFAERTVGPWFLWVGRARGLRCRYALAALAGTIPITVAAVGGAATAALTNALYGRTPPAPGPGVARVVAAAGVGVAMLALWGIVGVAVTALTRSSSRTAVLLLAWLALDATLSTRGGLAPYLLVMRIAQLGTIFWQPATPLTVDVPTFLWWIGPPEAPWPRTPWVGAAVVVPIVAALAVWAHQRIAAVEARWEER